jgi:hypothetical protein
VLVQVTEVTELFPNVKQMPLEKATGLNRLSIATLRLDRILMVGNLSPEKN